MHKVCVFILCSLSYSNICSATLLPNLHNPSSMFCFPLISSQQTWAAILKWNSQDSTRSRRLHFSSAVSLYRFFHSRCVIAEKSKAKKTFRMLMLRSWSSRRWNEKELLFVSETCSESLNTIRTLNVSHPEQEDRLCGLIHPTVNLAQRQRNVKRLLAVLNISLQTAKSLEASVDLGCFSFPCLFTWVWRYSSMSNIVTC